MSKNIFGSADRGQDISHTDSWVRGELSICLPIERFMIWKTDSEPCRDVMWLWFFDSLLGTRFSCMKPSPTRTAVHSVLRETLHVLQEGTLLWHLVKQREVERWASVTGGIDLPKLLNEWVIGSRHIQQNNMIIEVLLHYNRIQRYCVQVNTVRLWEISGSCNDNIIHDHQLIMCLNQRLQRGTQKNAVVWLVVNSRKSFEHYWMCSRLSMWHPAPILVCTVLHSSSMCSQ